MPTGYTYEVPEGQTFKDFVLGCSRAFGALVSLRDADYVDLEEYEEKISTYHGDSLIKAKAGLKEFKSLGLRAIIKEYEQYTLDSINSYNKSMEKNDRLIKKYSKMIDEVKRWVPPTQDHFKLKEFMLEQLNSSMEFDIMEPTLNIKNFKKWYLEKLSNFSWVTNYHLEGHQKELERVARNNKWLKDLLGSL